MEQTNVRRGGVLLHITSLPGPECAGTLGEAAYRFVDFLQSAGTVSYTHLRAYET
mgnify:CR=1 FL=1